MNSVLVPVRHDDPPYFCFLAQRSQDGIQNGRVANENWRHWINLWRSNPLGYLWGQLHRTDSQGNLCQRVVIESERRTPNGVDPMAVTNGMAWDAIDRDRREIIIECVEQRRAEDRAAGRPELVVQFYTGAINDGFVGCTSNRSSGGVLDVDHDEHWEKFQRAWMPWIECGVLSGLGFDAGMHGLRLQPTLDLIRKLRDRIDGWGSFSEAFPFSSHSGGIVTRWDDIPADIETWCLANYILQRDPNGTHKVDRGGKLPQWVASTPHLTAGNTAPVRRAGTLTGAEARDFERRGFGVTSARSGSPWDSVVNLES